MGPEVDCTGDGQSERKWCEERLVGHGPEEYRSGGVLWAIGFQEFGGRKGRHLGYYGTGVGGVCCLKFNCEYRTVLDDTITGYDRDESRSLLCHGPLIQEM